MENEWTGDDTDTANGIFGKVQQLKALQLQAEAETLIQDIDNLIQAQMTRHGLEIPF